MSALTYIQHGRLLPKSPRGITWWTSADQMANPEKRAFALWYIMNALELLNNLNSQQVNKLWDLLRYWTSEK